jgi:hypothetical protein
MKSRKVCEYNALRSLRREGRASSSEDGRPERFARSPVWDTEYMSVCFGVKCRCVWISVRTEVRRVGLMRSGITICLYLVLDVEWGVRFR